MRGFNCGNTEWQVALNIWITTNEVWDNIRDRGTSVWIYRRGNDLVGYGSVGTTARRYPPPKGNRLDLAIIPMLALQLPYQGEPQWAAKDDRYSGQIMNDLIFKARSYGLPHLVLYVHPNNEPAKGLYRKFGFQSFGLVNNGNEMMGLPLA